MLVVDAEHVLGSPNELSKDDRSCGAVSNVNTLEAQKASRSNAPSHTDDGLSIAGTAAATLMSDDIVDRH